MKRGARWIPLAVLVLLAAGAAVLSVTVRGGLSVRRRRVRAGPEELIGHLGVVRSWRTSVAVSCVPTAWRT